MTSKRDKRVIEHWVCLYNCLMFSTFRVLGGPDDDSMKKNVDAVCVDECGRTFAVEHTLIQPYDRAKEDDARFMRTLGSLENHLGLVEPGYDIQVRQAVGVVPNGID